MSDKIDDVYIVLPIYNEDEVLEDVINELRFYFKNIIAINDGSTDNSRKIIEKYNDIILIDHPINAGQGLAISTGIKYVQLYSKAKAIVTFDADGQHSSKDARDFAIEILKCEEEVIFGSRFIDRDSNVPFIKKIALNLIAKISNFILGMTLTDAHNGMKALKTSCLNKINFEISGFGFESELVSIIAKNKIKYKELKTHTLYTAYSIKKGQKLLNGLRIIEDLLMR